MWDLAACKDEGADETCAAGDTDLQQVKKKK
jgi:hypothetical protein